ncbi:MAG: hypothetical protein Q9160_001033 [Pyrenula sp. 1 TL-2023]
MDEKYSKDAEVEMMHAASYDTEDPVEFDEKKDLRRGLGQRHIQMIALAGTIGTGLFLGSGRAIANAGPAGALMGYTFVGILVSCAVISIAEMSALVPLSGSIVRHAEYFFDPALSFAEGWNFVYANAMGLPAEITAASTIIQFWTTSVNVAVWLTILGFFIIITNLFFVRVYGELEFTFATLKIMLIVGLNLMAIGIAAGGGPDHHAYGVHYWRDPGPFVQYLSIGGSLGRFLGFWTTFANAAYAYSSIETIAMAAAETKSPRRNIPKAAKRIFVRILLFYVISIFMVGLIVPSNEPKLLKSTGTASQSPFVIAATSASIPVVPHIINAIVLTSAWSAGNAGMLNGSRVLYGLARERHAPRILLRVNRFGIPYLAVCGLGAFMALAYMSVQETAAKVFTWFQDLVAAAAIMHWIVICAVYLRFYYGMQRQSISRDELPWKGPLQPYAAWTGLVSLIIILLTGGYAVFIHGHWDTETFISAYFNIPLILVLYFGYKLVMRTKLVPLETMPIREYLEIARDNPEPPEKPNVGWRRLNILWS